VSFFGDFSTASAIIISISLMLFGGYISTRITSWLHLPAVTGYICCGILLGSFCLNLIPASVIGGMDFLPVIAVAFIAFSTGQFFRINILKRNGAKVILIAFLETFLASACVFVALSFLGISTPFKIVLSALAAATAPASTMMTIRQTHAKGDFVDTLLQTVAVDEIIGLIEFSVAVTVALSLGGGHQLNFTEVFSPVLKNLLILFVGGIYGCLLQLFMLNKNDGDNRLIICLATLISFCGICSLLDLSPLLGVMMMSTVYINLSNDDNLYKQMNYFSPPIMVLFFVRSGLSFDLGSLLNVSSSGEMPLLLICGLYIIFRAVGKYGGAWLGCSLTGKKPNVRNYLGLALFSQASVAIGLGTIAARSLGGEIGHALQTVVMTTSIIYEFIGPVSAKLSLSLSGAISNKLEDVVPEVEEGMTSVEELIERIRIIHEMNEKNDLVKEQEKVFTEAADELYRIPAINRNMRRRNK